jgi:hypothetical protein
VARSRQSIDGTSARPTHLRQTAAVACAIGLSIARPVFGEDGASSVPGRSPHQAPPVPAAIDRTAVRFFAPETGGVAFPRFIFQRVLAFEARLAQMAEVPDGIGESYDERLVREAIEHHVAEEMLASLAERLVAESLPDKRPKASDLAAVERDVGGAFVERLGGRARIDGAAQAEQIDRAEVDAILRRGALAAFYVDRAVTPILHPSEEQLRNVFRTSAHPYRGQPFEQVRVALERWFVIERVRVAESAFLQAARSRVRIIVTP